MTRLQKRKKKRMRHIKHGIKTNLYDEQAPSLQNGILDKETKYETGTKFEISKMDNKTHSRKCGEEKR